MFITFVAVQLLQQQLDTNVIRDCVILLSQRCHLNILSPIGTLSQRRRKKRKK